MNQITTPYFLELRQKISTNGGLFNAHLHIDRSGTLNDTIKIINSDQGASSHISLKKKHSIIPAIHESDCYSSKNLSTRVSEYIQMMIAVGTTRADTLVDVTDDNLRLSALETLLQTKEKYSNSIDFRLGAYSPLGFRDDQPNRWEILKLGAKVADFIGALPERDDQEIYPEHIGFDLSCRQFIELSIVLNKPLHIHLDQQNHPHENDTERFLEIVEDLAIPVHPDQEPYIWLIHVISPSTYDENRFKRLLKKIKKYNLGIICCPSAAISMRQIRDIYTPTYNSIARVLDMLAMGIWVRIGSDNICDITSPAGTIDLVDEIFVLCNALRFYDLDVMSKIASGLNLSTAEQAKIRNHLRNDEIACDEVIDRYKRKMKKI
jgi:cytosine deaminase